MSSFEDSTIPDPLIEAGLGINPIDLYLTSNRETRLNILVNHPQVYGFIHFYEDTITKVFLPRRLIDWRSNEKSVAAVSGTPEDFVPFSVPEEALTGNNLYLCEAVKFHEDVKSLPVARFFKDNGKKLEKVPECASSDAKAKNLVVVSFPTVLPLVRGFSFEEGSIHDEFVTRDFDKVHDLFEVLLI